jgi:hypothetical protein
LSREVCDIDLNQGKALVAVLAILGIPPLDEVNAKILHKASIPTI